LFFSHSRKKNIFVLPAAGWIWAWLVLATATGCNNRKYLREGEHLVVRNTVHFDSTAGKEATALKYNLSNLVLQKPNEKLFRLFRTRLWFHNRFDTPCRKQERNPKKQCRFKYWLRDKIGQPPVLYDTVQTQKTVESMRNFLHGRGFFDAQIAPSVSFQGKYAQVHYTVLPGRRLLIDSLTVSSPDTALLAYVAQHLRPEEKLVRGKPLDTDVLNAERSRIAAQLREVGYFYFVPNYVQYELDSANSELGAHVYLNISPPGDSLRHRIFSLDSVFVLTQFRTGKQPKVDTMVLDGYHFLTPVGEKAFMRRRALERFLFFGPDSLYRFGQALQTNLALRDLSAYRNVTLEYQRTAYDRLNCRVGLTPAKRMSFGADFETSTASNLLGISTNVFVRHNNFLRGGEVLTLNAEGGVELNLNRIAGDQGQLPPVINTSDLNLTLNLLIPNAGFLPSAFKIQSGRSRIRFQYNRLVRTNFFRYNSINADYSYFWQRENKKHQFAWSIFNASLLLPTLDPDFEANVVANSQFLRNTFKPYVIMGLMSNFSWTYNGYEPARRKGQTLRIRFDASGLLLNAVDWAFVPGRLQFFDNNTDYSQFVRGDLEWRQTLPVGRKSLFVCRFFGGVAVPYGNSIAVPYVRQYNVGGANSIRAWPIRQLGPGSYRPAGASSANLDVTGDIRLEANAELRFPVFWLLEGAVFVDAGNVWNIRADPDRPGTSFGADRFLSEIAVGSGIGMRINFSYFILRFDVAMRIRSPYDNPDWNDGRWVDRFDGRDIGYNLAIGFPF
jgi:outer membrane protein insertion porin family